MYSIAVFLKDPISNTEVFVLLSFKPYIDLKASKIYSTSVKSYQ